MIEDKTIGLKYAENSEEAFWHEIKEKSEKATKQCEHEIVIQAVIRGLAEQKLKEIGIPNK